MLVLANVSLSELQKLEERIGYRQLIPSFVVSISFQQTIQKHQKDHV